uniref:Uncharacterized protein n=1 Tax=Solanum lycopersicum TaxID=4081 RepID=A0A3Q7GDZ3_SOLLC
MNFFLFGNPKITWSKNFMDARRNGTNSLEGKMMRFKVQTSSKTGKEIFYDLCVL